MAKIDPKWRVMANANIEGWVKELNSYVSEYQSTSKGMMKRINNAINIIEEQSNIFVPVDTGDTKRSWYRDVEVKDDEIVGIFGYDKNNTIPYLGLIYMNPYRRVFQTKKGAIDPQEKWLEAAYIKRKKDIEFELRRGFRTRN